MTWLALLQFAAACGGGSATATAPSEPPPPPVPSVKSIGFGASGGIPGRLAVGQQIQLHGWATMSDNSVKDVTADALFSSTRSDVATITPQGLMTGIAPGSTGMHIEYQSLSNEWQIVVEGPEIVAFVHEDSARNVCLAAARVQLNGAPYNGEVLTADNEGRVRIPNWQTAPFTVTVSRPNYAPATVAMPEFPRPTSADIALRPLARVVDRTWDGTFAPDQCDLPNYQDGMRSLSFIAAADGVLTINRIRMDVVDIGGYQLWRDGRPEPYQCPITNGGVLRGAYSVTRGVRYELRVMGFGCGPRWYPRLGDFHMEYSVPE